VLFFIADWHALTTDYADTSRLKENSVEVMLGLAARGAFDFVSVWLV